MSQRGIRLVVQTDLSTLEFNYLWAPFWIGANSTLKKEMEQALKQSIEGRPLTAETLDYAHDLVVKFLQQKFPAMQGLQDYLDSVKFVEPT